MKSAVIYCRVSTAKQAEEELPIASQLARCHEKARDLGASVLRVFEDAGVSGRDADARPAFLKAIAYCEASPPDYFITWSTSRFARNRIDAASYKVRLARLGVDLVYASQQIDRDSDGGWLTEGVMELFDELYSRQVAADTRRSMLMNAQAGYFCGGRVPYGYRAECSPADPRRRCLVPDPAESAIVRRIFHLRAAGYGAALIAGMLRREGVTARGGGSWTKPAVRAVLDSEASLGNIVFGRRSRIGGKLVSQDRADWIVVPSHAAIITREEWDAAHAAIAAAAPVAETGSPHSRHLLTGLLVCGACGASMQIETAKGRSKRYSYYACRNAQVHGTCEHRRLPADALDAWLVSALCADVLSPSNVGAMLRELGEATKSWDTDRRQRIAAAKAELKDLRQRNSRLYDILELHGRDAPNLGDLSARLRANNDRSKAIEAAIAMMEGEAPPEIDYSESDLGEVIEILAECLRDTADPQRIRAFLGTFVRRIAIEAASASVEYEPKRLFSAANRPVQSKVRWLPETSCQGTARVVLVLPAHVRVRPVFRAPGRRGASNFSMR